MQTRRSTHLSRTTALPPALGPVIALALMLVAAAAWTGCSLELGDIPFKCHNGVPECPDGYGCHKTSADPKDPGICVRYGVTPPKLDAAQPPREGGTDGKPPPKEGGSDHGPTPDLPVKLDGQPVIPGKVVITEFMANPDAGGKVTDTNGEWIELYNLGSTGVDINGWKLKDAGTDLHVINNGGPLVVPPKGYILLGNNKDMAYNGGVKLAYAYKGSDFQIANSEDEILLQDSAGKQVDGFTYTKALGFTIATGASLSVKGPTVDKNVAANWCTETAAWPGSLGDKGTPGFNPGCK